MYCCTSQSHFIFLFPPDKKQKSKEERHKVEYEIMESRALEKSSEVEHQEVGLLNPLKIITLTCFNCILTMVQTYNYIPVRPMSVKERGILSRVYTAVWKSFITARYDRAVYTAFIIVPYI